MEQIKYNGREAWLLERGDTKVYVVPELGGRIMQIEFGGHKFLFENESLRSAPNTQPTPEWNGLWQNFGGEKIWPSPQGWSGDHQWPGPPDPVLDGGIYTAEVSDAGVLRLTSPHDNFTGLTITRDISLDERGINISASLVNGASETRRWAVWPVIQLAASDTPGEESVVTIPANPESIYSDGFKISHGLVNSPQFAREGRNVIARYGYLVGKMGADSAAGWAAFSDSRSGKVMVVDYGPKVAGAEYPGGNTIEVWTQGRGIFYSRGEVKELANDKAANPPYLEIEPVSPLRDIPPDGRNTLDYRLRMCTIPKGGHVVDAGPDHVESSPPIVDGKGRLTMGYGFFSGGTIEIVATTPNNETVLFKAGVSPLEGFEYEGRMPDEAATVIIIFTDTTTKESKTLKTIEL